MNICNDNVVHSIVIAMQFTVLKSDHFLMQKEFSKFLKLVGNVPPTTEFTNHLEGTVQYNEPQVTILLAQS